MTMTTVVARPCSRTSLGGTFHGHLVSDFYCGYNVYAGKQQSAVGICCAICTP